MKPMLDSYVIRAYLLFAVFVLIYSSFRWDTMYYYSMCAILYLVLFWFVFLYLGPWCLACPLRQLTYAYFILVLHIHVQIHVLHTISIPHDIYSIINKIHTSLSVKTLDNWTQATLIKKPINSFYKFARSSICYPCLSPVKFHGFCSHL